MSKHLFKQEKDRKTVGYLELYQDGNVRLEWKEVSCPWTHNNWPYHLQEFLKKQKVTSIRSFVCKDKNGKDVWRYNGVWYHRKGFQPLRCVALASFENWVWVYSKSGPTYYWHHPIPQDIELIEEPEK